MAKLPPACEGCPAAQTAVGFCPPGATHPSTRLVAFGESPGQTEVESGHGFTGQSGKLLRGWMRRAGLSVASGWPDDMPGRKVEEVAFRNAHLCRQPGNAFLGKEIVWECMRRHGHLYPLTSETTLTDCGSSKPSSAPMCSTSPRNSPSPVPLIAFGANSVESLTGYRLPIQKVRGSILPLRSELWEEQVTRSGTSGQRHLSGSPKSGQDGSNGSAPSTGHSGGWLTASLHPAFLVRGGGSDNPEGGDGKSQTHLEPTLALDCRRALAATVPRVPVVHWYARVGMCPPSPPDGSLVSVDIEGAGGQPNIVGVSWDQAHAHVMPWSEQARQYLEGLFRTNPVVGHNMAYDVPELEMAGVTPPKVWFDTINMAALYDPSLPMNLQFQVLTHVDGTTTWKGLVDHAKGPDFEGGQVQVYRELWRTILTNLGRPVPRTGTEWYVFYNALDTAWSLALADVLQARLAQQGRLAYYTDLMQPLQAPLLEMGRRGMPVDEARLAAWAKECQTKSDECLKVLNERAQAGQQEKVLALQHAVMNLELERECKRAKGERKFSRAKELSSLRTKLKTAQEAKGSIKRGKQFASLLYDWYGLPVIKTEKDGRATNEAAIADLTSRVTRGTAKPKQGTKEEVLEVLAAIEGYNHWQTWLGNFLNPPIERRGGVSFIPTSYSQHRTDTGRLSSGADLSDPDKPGTKTRKAQMQNWPKELRDVVRAPEDTVFVGGDWAAIQLALFLWDASKIYRDGFHESLLDRMWEGKLDPHRYLASVAEGTPEDQISKDDPRRQNCKQYTFGLLFGGSERTLARKAGHSDSVGIRMGRAHEQAFRKDKWWAAMMALVKKQHWIGTPLGWRRYFWAYNPKREEVLATRIQALEADLFKWTLARMNASLPLAWKWLTTTHDFIGLWVPEQDAEDAVQWMKGAMEQPVPWLDGRTFRADVRVGENWRVI